MSLEVKEWYNEFSKKQIVTSVNLRHYTIFSKIRKYGLRRDSTILEIGSGIGTLTGLLHSFVKKGHIVAVDISNESIEIAKQRIGTSKRIDYLVSDMSDFSHNLKFDFIVLPDVLEHIPIEQHTNIFKVCSQHMHLGSKIIINIPHPKAIEYLRKTAPDKLQIIDQALKADELLLNAYTSDLLLVDYTSYSIFNKEHDYAFVLFKKNQDITLTKLSKFRIVLKKQYFRMKHYFEFLF